MPQSTSSQARRGQPPTAASPLCNDPAVTHAHWLALAWSPNVPALPQLPPLPAPPSCEGGGLGPLCTLGSVAVGGRAGQAHISSSLARPARLSWLLSSRASHTYLSPPVPVGSGRCLRAHPMCAFAQPRHSGPSSVLPQMPPRAGCCSGTITGPSVTGADAPPGRGGGPGEPGPTVSEESCISWLQSVLGPCSGNVCSCGGHSGLSGSGGRGAWDRLPLGALR